MSQIRAKYMDNRPTMAEWPIRIWNQDEFPEVYKNYALAWMKEDFSSYHFVLSPRRKSSTTSYEYLFGYGNGEILYLRKVEHEMKKIVVRCEDIISVKTFRELLNCEICIQYRSQAREYKLIFPYIPSTYYLYDPFLNWLLGIDRDFSPLEAERENPRPQRLMDESLVMYNYSLHAYRLGNGFDKYQYRFEKHRPKWTPWKVRLKEWLEITMERGIFQLYSYGYITECTYLLKKQ